MHVVLDLGGNLWHNALCEGIHYSIRDIPYYQIWKEAWKSVDFEKLTEEWRK